MRSDVSALTCQEKEDAADKSAAKIFLLTDPNVRQFKTLDQFDQRYCQMFPSWIKDMSNYRSCLRPFQKTLFNMMIISMRRTWKKFCTNQKSMEVVFQHLKCIDPETKPVFMRMGDKITTGVTYLANLPQVNDMIPGLCCSLLDVSEEGEQITAEACRDKTGPETGKFVVEVTYSALSDAVEIMCGNFQTKADCEAKVPDLMRNMTAVLASPKHHNHSPLKPMLKFVNRMDKEFNV